MTGRGAWPTDGDGGTLNIDGTRPGPFYRLNDPGVPRVGLPATDDPSQSERAVHYGVRAIQRTVNRQLGGANIHADGVFGEETDAAVRHFQKKNRIYVDGVVGRETSTLLFTTVATRLATTRVPACLLVGLVTNESAFDPGAVGTVDDRDLGLVQINGHWHPDMSEDERFSPVIAIDYAVGMYEAALGALQGNLEDAVAAYNLGIGGARTWIEHGRPDVITYYSSGPVDIRSYITRILSGCNASNLRKESP